jgi:acyl-homoserine-lactone acylase
MRSLGVLLLVHVFATSTSCAWRAGPQISPPSRSAEGEVEILWDRWGVPHIYATDIPSLFFGFGWAQMEMHGDLLLLLYGRARARGAEYWGAAHRETDEFLRVMDAPRRTAQWYGQQTPAFRANLDAFAAGINAYARAHPDRIVDSVHVVVPVSGADVLAATQLSFHFTYLTGAGALSSARAQITRGSSGWAIGPGRSASGHAMLLANPHVPWDPPLVEAHLLAPGIELYGATLPGFPVLVLGFNRRLGWTHTVNTVDPVDRFELRLGGDGYLFDGEVRPFEQRLDTLRVRELDGTIRQEEILIRRTVHGPVMAQQDGRAVVDRVVGLDTPGLLEQWWEMGQARNLAEFMAALRRHQLPLLTVLYADRDGRILHQFAGHVPVRYEGDFMQWRFGGTLRGDTSATLWSRIHPFEELPTILDPASGYLQNSNEAPWFTTLPTLAPGRYPPHMAPARAILMRSQRALRILEENRWLSLEDVIEYKHSTRMELADRVLDDLLRAARDHGTPLALAAADVLTAWDRGTDAESRGAILFTAWVRELRAGLPFIGGWTGQQPLFARQFEPDAPLTTPWGLADLPAAALALERAADSVQRVYGRLDMAWGDVYRLRGGGLDLPGNGTGDPYGVLRATFYRPLPDNRFVAAGGDAWVAAVEFSDPVRAWAVLPHGNASQPHSMHRWDQLELYARKELREVLLTRSDVEANTVARQVLRFAPNFPEDH